MLLKQLTDEIIELILRWEDTNLDDVNPTEAAFIKYLLNALINLSQLFEHMEYILRRTK